MPIASTTRRCGSTSSPGTSSATGTSRRPRFLSGRLAVEVFAADGAAGRLLEAESRLITALARVDPLTFLDTPARPRHAAIETLDGVELYVPLAGVVDDVGGELRRLERELAKVEDDLGG